MKFPFRVSSLLFPAVIFFTLSCLCVGASNATPRAVPAKTPSATRSSSSGTPDDAGAPASLAPGETAIPGPLRSFLRMAGISQQASPEEVLPLLARAVMMIGYQSSGMGGGKRTDRDKPPSSQRPTPASAPSRWSSSARAYATSTQIVAGVDTTGAAAVLHDLRIPLACVRIRQRRPTSTSTRPPTGSTERRTGTLRRRPRTS